MLGIFPIILVPPLDMLGKALPWFPDAKELSPTNIQTMIEGKIHEDFLNYIPYYFKIILNTNTVFTVKQSSEAQG